MKARLPDSTVGQILGILLGGLVLTLGLTLTLLAWLRPADTAVLRWPRSDALQIASLIDALGAAPVALRPAIAAAVATPGLQIRLGPPAPACAAAMEPGSDMALARALLNLLPKTLGVAVFHCRPNPANFVVEVRAPAIGAVFDIDAGPRREPLFALRQYLPMVVSFVFLFIIVGGLSVWAVLRIIGPLQRLARTVDRFGREVEVSPFAEEGPREIRLAARAFNQMQQRVASAMRDRTRMLAAVSHDLRTPLTRMRLRAELEQSGEYREKTLRDLDLMRSMIAAALAFLRGAEAEEPVETLDVGSLLQSICDEFREAGENVSYAGTASIFCRCRPNGLTRAVTNLLENACRYGSRAVVDTRLQQGWVEIDVLDDGPGIPDAGKQEAMQPFARLDPARAMGDGVGLGLAIVADVARLHGGRLVLLDGSHGGLQARLILPLNAAGTAI